jgi:hypothetical protein
MPGDAAMTDQYQLWAEALEEGRGVETEPGSPRSGFYRYKNEAFALWRDDNGKLLCWRSDAKRRTPTEPDEIDDLFGYVARYPITYEAFQAFRETCKWPEDVEPPIAPPLSPETALAFKVSALKEEAEAWAKGLGKLLTKVQADKAANYSVAFAGLETEAELLRVAAKAPVLDAGRKIDAVWRPLVQGAGDLKRWAKKLAESYLIAERARLAREAEARRAQGATVHDHELKALAGTQGRVIALRSRQAVEIIDLPAFLRHLAEINNPPLDFVEACEKVARAMTAAGQRPPGVEVRRVEQIA